MDVADKTVLLNEGLAAEHLLHNDTELAIQNMTQLMSVDGVTIVGPLPGEIQVQTTYVAGISSQSMHKDIAGEFIAYLVKSTKVSGCSRASEVNQIGLLTAYWQLMSNGNSWSSWQLIFMS